MHNTIMWRRQVSVLLVLIVVFQLFGAIPTFAADVVFPYQTVPLTPQDAVLKFLGIEGKGEFESMFADVDRDGVDDIILVPYDKFAPFAIVHVDRAGYRTLYWVPSVSARVSSVTVDSSRNVHLTVWNGGTGAGTETRTILRWDGNKLREIWSGVVTDTWHSAFNQLEFHERESTVDVQGCTIPTRLVTVETNKESNSKDGLRTSTKTAEYQFDQAGYKFIPVSAGSSTSIIQEDDRLCNAIFAAATRMRFFKLVEGSSNKDLALERYITRAEFITMIVRTFGFEEKAKGFVGPVSYADTANHWAAGYIEVAKTIVAERSGGRESLGVPLGKFNPDGKVTSAEAIAFLMKFLGVPRDQGVWPQDYLGGAQKAAILSTQDRQYLTRIANVPATRGLVFYLADSSFSQYKLRGQNSPYAVLVEPRLLSDYGIAYSDPDAWETNFVSKTTKKLSDMDGIKAIQWRYDPKNPNSVTGCAPSAAANIMAYWARKGYPNLNANNYLNDIVAELRADMWTWQSSDGTGTTLAVSIDHGMEEYVERHGYSVDSKLYKPGTLLFFEPTWEIAKEEIENGRPFMLNVYDHPYFGEHSVTVVGYREFNKTCPGCSNKRYLMILNNWGAERDGRPHEYMFADWDMLQGSDFVTFKLK